MTSGRRCTTTEVGIGVYRRDPRETRKYLGQGFQASRSLRCQEQTCVAEWDCRDPYSVE